MNEKRLFWILTSFATVSSIGSSMILPYIPLYGREIGMSVSLVGYLIFVYYGIEVFTRIPIGSLSDSLGHATVTFAGAVALIGAAVSYLLSVEATKLLFLAQLLFGIGMSITWVTIPSFITKTEKSVFTYSFSVGLGWLIGPPIGGHIKDLWGMYSLFELFLVNMVVLLGLALLFYINDPERSEKSDVILSRALSRVSKSYKRAFHLLNKQRIVIAGVVSFLMFMIFAMGASLIPLYFSSIGFISFYIGVLQSVRTGSSTTIRLVAKKILTVANDVTVLVLGMGLTGLSVILITMTESLLPIAILCAVWGIGGGFYLPIVFDLIGKCTDQDERGLAMGLRGTMGTMGSAIGVLAFSNIAEFFSVQISLQLLGIFGVTSTIVLLGYWKFRVNTDEEEEC